MKIWFIHQHATPPSSPGHTRPYDYARALMKLGHDVYVMTSNFNHVTKSHDWLQEGEKCRYMICDGVKFVWIRTPGYGGNTIKRIWDMIVFAVRIYRGSWSAYIPEPDIVIGSTPPPFGCCAAEIVARRYGVPFVLDIRDLWPETLLQLSNVSRFNPFIILLGWAENYLYNRADSITCVLPDAMEYIAKKAGTEKVIEWLPNGVSNEYFSFKKLNRDNNAPFTVMYAGAHGVANALESILHAAKLVQSMGITGSEILFRFIGQGPEKSKLIRLAEELELNNVQFDEPVPKHEIFGVLESADVLIVTLRNIPLYKYGMSLNKLHDYMSVGKPIIFGAEIAQNPVEIANAGLSVPPEDSHAMAEAVIKLYKMPNDQLEKHGASGQEYITANHQLDGLARRLEVVLENTLRRS